MPTMRVTRAPRSRAASATATPIVPVLRLPMKRTGSIGSAVPPAVTTTWRPARSSASRASASGGAAGEAGRPVGGIGPPHRAVADRGDDGVDDRAEVGEAARAHLARGEGSALGLDDRVPEPVAQDRDVRLRGRMGVHVAVHRRGDDDRRGGGEAGRGDDVGGEPVGHRPQPVGRRRGDEDRVGRVGREDVADPAVGEEVEHLGVDVAAARARPGSGARRSAWRRAS